MPEREGLALQVHQAHRQVGRALGGVAGGGAQGVGRRAEGAARDVRVRARRQDDVVREGDERHQVVLRDGAHQGREAEAGVVRARRAVQGADAHRRRAADAARQVGAPRRDRAVGGGADLAGRALGAVARPLRPLLCALGRRRGDGAVPAAAQPRRQRDRRRPRPPRDLGAADHGGAQLVRLDHLPAQGGHRAGEVLHRARHRRRRRQEDVRRRLALLEGGVQPLHPDARDQELGDDGAPGEAARGRRVRLPPRRPLPPRLARHGRDHRRARQAAQGARAIRARIPAQLPRHSCATL